MVRLLRRFWSKLTSSEGGILYFVLLKGDQPHIEDKTEFGPGIYCSRDLARIKKRASETRGSVGMARVQGSILRSPRPVSKSSLKKLLQWAPENLQEPCPDSLYVEILSASSDPFLQAWYELYPGWSREYIRTLLKLGIDAREAGSDIVVYNPECLELMGIIGLESKDGKETSGHVARC
jgi:hypothetical protein